MPHEKDITPLAPLEGVVVDKTVLNENDFGSVQVTAPNDIDEEIDGRDLEVTKEDLRDAEDRVGTLSLRETFKIITEVHKMHQYDQNFPAETLERINEFLNNREAIEANEKDYGAIIHEMKLAAVLVTENSPYAEVRAVVDPTDDPDLPVWTFRVMFIGIVYSAIGVFVNQLFSIRMPPVQITSNVAQLLAYPLGVFMAKVLPKAAFTIRGRQYSFNPGPFNQKEHMLITIMANVGFNTPYTSNIIFVQVLPFFFNQPYAKSFGYQICGTLGTNFVGYGLAGLSRRFLVYPSFCIWPSSLMTIALNKAFHGKVNEPVQAPFGRTWTMSRYKFFLIAFFGMAAYFFIPDFLAGFLSSFNWLTWIAPYNATLANITGFNSGLGFNPWPTFDWNIMTTQFTPLVLPAFATYNALIGMVAGGFMIIGLYYTNAWNTSYMPINSNKSFDHTGARYNVSKILDHRGIFDAEKYQTYSEPWMAAGNLTIYFWFFACYAATISYTFIYHRHEIAHGFKGLNRSLKAWYRRVRGKTVVAEDDEVDLAEDIHYKLMAGYPEVSEFWYLAVLVVSAALGMTAIGAWPTYTTPATVIYGIVLALIFVVPIGLIMAVTGGQVTLNVLAEFIGGSWVAGNALAMNTFKSYGYVVTAHCLSFAQDLKLAHYTKIPPMATFAGQMIATVVSSFVATALINYQLSIKNICTPEAPFGMTCPGLNTFFTAAVFWGSIGPVPLFGVHGRYKALLTGFPVGFMLPIILWGLTKLFPRQRWIRQLHPVMICMGGLWWAPYNFSYVWGGVILTFVSWTIIKKRYLAFWAKYNYILAAALSAGVAVTSVIIFFALTLPAVEVNWWGNNPLPATACDAKGGCIRYPKSMLPEKGYFGADPGNYAV